MDQDVALDAIRDIVEGPELDFGEDGWSDEDIVNILDQRARLIELISGLDRWLSRGGALPSKWAKHSAAHKDSAVLDLVHAEMSAPTPWSADTLDVIADLIRLSGREIPDPNELENTDA